ncbi:MAG: class I SAM-dependent methyltransferase [Burkholderiaceae bacterium]
MDDALPAWWKNIRRDAPWRFDRFMQAALYDPQSGYYSRGGMLGAPGDFVTAPELTPLFGETLAYACAEAVVRCGGQVWEFGAGRGSLAAHWLNALGARIDVYHIVELSAALQAEQRQTIAALAPAQAHKVRWANTLPTVLEGVVLGNEVLDAMPVRLWRWYPDGVRELFVAPDDAGQALCFVERPASSELTGLVQRLHGHHGPWPEGYQSEWAEQTAAFLRTLTDKLRGIALMIDYGFEAATFYHPQRHTGTLVAHRRHRCHDDVLNHIGDQDLTAHVNFSAAFAAIDEAGGELLGYGTQAAVLLEAGILRAPQLADAVSDVSGARQRHAVQTLLSEAEMGELFKIFVWCKGVETDDLPLAALLSATDRSHRL